MEEYLNIDLESLAKTIITKIKGVYFLYKNDELVYIGSSKNILERIPKHLKDKDFNFYRYIEVKEGEVAAKIETLFIRKFQPRYNISVIYNPNKEKVKEKIIKIKKRIKTKKVIRKLNSQGIMEEFKKSPTIKVVFQGYKNGKKYYKEIK